MHALRPIIIKDMSAGTVMRVYQLAISCNLNSHDQAIIDLSLTTHCDLKEILLNDFICKAFAHGAPPSKSFFSSLNHYARMSSWETRLGFQNQQTQSLLNSAFLAQLQLPLRPSYHLHAHI